MPQAFAEARIRLLWFKQAQFAGPLLAEQRGLARARGVEIVCEPADLADPPVEALLDGRVEFAVASPAHALESRDPSALALLLVVQQSTSLAYGVRVDAGIEGPSDLAGRRVAVWPGGEDLELRWLLARACGSADSAHRIEAADTVAELVAGRADAAQMTVYHELHEAERALGAHALRVVRAEDCGAGLVKDGLLVRRDLLEDRIWLADAVVAAILEGWSIALDDPGAAVSACSASRPDMTVEDHARQLADIRGLVLAGATSTHGLGFPDPEHARRAALALRETGTIPRIDPDRLIEDGPWRRTPVPHRQIRGART